MRRSPAVTTYRSARPGSEANSSAIVGELTAPTVPDTTDPVTTDPVMTDPGPTLPPASRGHSGPAWSGASDASGAAAASRNTQVSVRRTAVTGRLGSSRSQRATTGRLLAPVAST